MRLTLIHLPRTRARWLLAALIVFLAFAGAAGWYLSRHASASSCADLALAQKRFCWRDEIKSSLAGQGVDAALALLAKLYASDPEFSVYCHEYAHLIGNTAYEQFSKNKATQLSPQASYCGFGFYHGFMESLLYTTGDLKQAQDFCAYAQQLLGGDAKGACYHGIGHGFLDGTNREHWGDAPAMVKEGLSLCERVGESPYFINRCASGIFNSLAILTDNPNVKDSITTDPNDPYWVCRLQTKSYFRTPCFEEMNTLAYRLGGGDLAKAAQPVSRIRADADAAAAMEALASYSVRFRIADFNDTEEALLCHSLPERLHLPCMRGLGVGLVEFGAPGQEYVKSLAFCQSSGLSEEEKHACLARVIPYLGVIYPGPRMEALCQSAVEPEHRKEFCP